MKRLLEVVREIDPNGWISVKDHDYGTDGGETETEGVDCCHKCWVDAVTALKAIGFKFHKMVEVEAE